MDVKGMSNEDLRDLKATIEKEQNERIISRNKDVEYKLQLGIPFTEDELFYSARTHCPCGAGLAYPKNIGMHGYWDCSDILKGCADASKTHTGQLPFSMYDIKGESERRGTTRPNGEVHER